MNKLAANLTKIVLGGMGVLVSAVGAQAYQAMGWNAGVVTGWLLAATVLYLAAYNLRRRLSVLPVGRMGSWTAAHLFFGWLAIALFLVHIELRWPDGMLESALAALFAVTAISGVFGQWLSRRLPRRLDVLDEELIFERLPIFRRQLRESAENVAALAVEARPDSPLAVFFLDELYQWFGEARNLTFAFGRAERRQHEFERALAALERHLTDSERPLVAELKALLRKKHELDVSYTYQWLLKGWLLIHVPSAFAMIVLMVAHAASVHAFRGL